MPEGDTIFRAARALRRALAGRTITRFESMFPRLNRIDEDEPISGRMVEGVDSRGKHLLIRLSGNLTLRTHMRMKGSWHIYRRGERWMRSRRDTRIVLEAGDIVAVGFSIPDAEAFATDAESKNRELGRLGPDLLDAGFDREEAVKRLRSRMAVAADALLDQTVMAGVGNVYKSEVLFLCGVHPSRIAATLGHEELCALVETARELLIRNVSPARRRAGRRTTTNRLDPAAKLWVYGRRSRGCRRCGTTILADLIGKDARLTFWCPTCQPRDPGPNHQFRQTPRER